MDLIDRLRAVVSDDRDIDAILSNAAGGGRQNGPNGTIEYLGTTGSGHFARAKLKHGKIVKLIPGPQLASPAALKALEERASSETSASHGTFVASRVLFAERQLKGTFIWTDSVRLSPCPETAPIGKGLDWFDPGISLNPQAGHLGPPFPFLLEVRIQRSPNPFIEANRILRQLDTYQYLLTLLINGHIRFAHWPSGRFWALLKRDGVPENHLIHPGFSTGESGRQDDFVPRESRSAAVFEGDDYYNNLWPTDSELLLPASLPEDLLGFNSLDREAASAFTRSCYWYALGIQARSEPSLATVAFSSAIECLLPRPKGSQCKECGKPMGDGPTKLFKEHVKRYGTASAELEKRRNDLYAVRSDLVHGTHAARVDLDFFSSRPEAHLLLLEIVCQRSLINWLRDPGRTT